MERFASSIGRGSSRHNDPETDEMREELNIYYEKEEKERLQQELEVKRKKHLGSVDEAEQSKAMHLKNAASQLGFIITDGRRKND